MYKYLVLIALHKRLDITRVVFENLKKLQEDFDFMVFGICSSREEAELCHDFNFDYCIEDNYPLGRKMNKGLLEAMKFDFEFLMQLGSDDIITYDLFDVYQEIDKSYWGVNQIYLVEPSTNRAKRVTYGGASNPIWHPFGAGRVFKKEALEKVLLHDDLWDDKQEKLLDNYSDGIMMKHGYLPSIYVHNFIGIIDIKGKENIWGFDEVDGEEFSYEKIEPYLCSLVS